jgi:DNA-binding HxlR family transcriptional regulator
MDSGRIYPHFCMMARALEDVGERWSLLIVRDLLPGPRRFTDLTRSLGGITPTRLTSRLRTLEAAGIVARERPASGREVWYSLTEAGRDLEPVVEALVLWGLEHAFEPPRPGEPVHPYHVMLLTKVWLDRNGTPPAAPVDWTWRFPGEEAYTLHFDGAGWPLARGEAQSATVAVITTPVSWGRFIASSGTSRRLPDDDIALEAPRTAAKAFARAFGATLDGK